MIGQNFLRPTFTYIIEKF